MPKVTFIVGVNEDEKRIDIEAPEGSNILDIARENNVPIEASCEGSLSCSTCHVWVEDPEYYNKLDEISEDEEDMLDVAVGLKENTSRLGCQLFLTKELDGMVLRVVDPSAFE